jgi:hypothetical protein
VKFGTSQISATNSITDIFGGRAAAAGDAYDTANAPTRITFSGANGISPTGASYSATSDWVSLPETYDNTKPFVIAWHCSASAQASLSTQAGSCTNYWQFPLNEAGTQNATTGYNPITSVSTFVQKIEVQ